MEITDIESAKKEIGNKVKFGKIDVPENLKEFDAITGTLIKFLAVMEYAKEDKILSLTYHVDVVDPKDGGIHHLTTDRIFSIDDKDADIKNIAIIDEIAKLDVRKAELEAQR
jgi:hypothetical protein